MTLLSNIQRWWFPHFDRGNLQQLTDEAILIEYQNSLSQSVLEVLINRHCDGLYHFLRSLSDTNLAEDISQLTWLKIVENPNRYHFETAQFRTWLFTTARNALIDELRRMNRWQWSDIDEVEIESTESWNESLSFETHPELQVQFNAALDTLPFAQREALMLQLDGFSLQDIADITYEKTETIKSRLRFARKSLKQQLEVSHEA